VKARRALALAFHLAAWGWVGPRVVAAQTDLVPVEPAQPARYLFTTNADDARALWVNPAGLVRQVEASLGADLTADRFVPGGSTQLSQYGITIANRGIAAGWVHDRFPNGPSLNTYAVGIGLGDERLSAGVMRRWLAGALKGSSWDVALRAGSSDGTQLSLVGRNIGSPRLNDSTFLGATVVPGALVSLLSGRLQAAGEWEVATRGWRSQEIRLGGGVTLSDRVAVSLRADLSPSFQRRGFTLAVTLQGPKGRAGAFALLPGGANEVDALGLSGAFVSRSAPPRR
jgi:hypothetical protein